jgi:hypothetical protein
MTTIYKQSKKIHEEKEMTDQYIISGEIVTKVYNMLMWGYVPSHPEMAELMNTLRSNPYQSEQLTENQKNTRLLREATHDYKIRRDELETVLDELYNTMKYAGVIALVKRLEELRKQVSEE